MLLVADIGNTNITFGVYDKDFLIKEIRLQTDVSLSCEEYAIFLETTFKDYKIKKIIIGSVVDEINETIKKACEIGLEVKPIIFTSELKTGVELNVKSPSSIGVDRIANAYYAFKNYSLPCIIIDLGTATTFDIISKNGKFFGGIIMPGLKMQLNSLCEKTSKLPKIEVQDIEKAIGIDTKTAILSGVIRGHACAIDGLIEQCENELGQKTIVVATGGLSKQISSYMSRKFDFINPTLTLDGFKELYYLNVNQEK